MADKKKVTRKVLAPAVGLQVVVGWLTVRDIWTRGKARVRGPRLLWTVWGGTNTLGSLMYWTVGRRRRPKHAQ